MFENLTQRLQNTFQKIMSFGKLTEGNIQSALDEIRAAFLEADVALSVVDSLIETVRQKAVGEKILQSLSAGQTLVKIVYDELKHVLGEAQSELNLKAPAPIVFMMAGLQGSGKTTTVGKLAFYLKNRYQKKVMVVSTDVYRPAAIDQLKIVSEQAQAQFYSSDITQKPVQIAKAAIEAAQKQLTDIVIIDTAGRLQVDDEMMKELKYIHEAIHPTETLLVVDAMIGQEAAHIAAQFQQAVPLSGIILTKMDGDSRGGAALSIWSTIHIPIKLVGTGEKIEAISAFYPDRLASRILNMGDIVSLAEEVEKKVDKKKTEKLAKDFLKGRFTLQHFLDQIGEMEKLGGITSLLDKLPGFGGLAPVFKQQIEQKASVFNKMKAVIQSMTIHERCFPAVINGSRKQRIAKGSGTDIQEINRVLKQYERMDKMMKKMTKGGGIMNMMNQMMGQF